jgi:hypothetical protein
MLVGLAAAQATVCGRCVCDSPVNDVGSRDDAERTQTLNPSALLPFSYTASFSTLSLTLCSSQTKPCMWLRSPIS